MCVCERDRTTDRLRMHLCVYMCVCLWESVRGRQSKNACVYSMCLHCVCVCVYLLMLYSIIKGVCGREANMRSVLYAVVCFWILG